MWPSSFLMVLALPDCASADLNWLQYEETCDQSAGRIAKAEVSACSRSSMLTDLQEGMLERSGFGVLTGMGNSMAAESELSERGAACGAGGAAESGVTAL